jgi:protein-disulfide isomerase
MNRWIAAGACSALLFSAAACQPAGQKDLEEIKAQIGQLAQKIDSLDAKLVAGAGGGGERMQPPGPPPEDFDKVYDIQVDASPVLGKTEAPVTLVEYSDFQCPFCARADPIIKEVQKKYPDKVRVVFKHFPLSFHEAARPTAIASMAAQEQGKFWEFHDVLFQNNSGLDGSEAGLEKYAKAAGLDVERFKKDMESKRAEYEARIEKDVNQGNEIDVRGTPTLYLNGKKLDPRKRSIDAMSAQIDALLAQKGS